MRLITLRTTLSAVALVLLGAAALPAYAQSGKGYLLGAPEGRITLRGGYALAAARSDLFDFTIQELSISRRDFSGLTGGLEIGVPLSSHWEVSIDGSFMRAQKGSHFREYVNTNDREIEQSTTFDRAPVLLNARYYFTAPGRSIGKLAWIPSQAAPWISGGAGIMYYRFLQQGSWVNYDNLNVFSDRFESSAWGPAFQGGGGFDINITPMLSVTTEARYIWSRGQLRSDFSGFDKLDLSGVSATVGLTVRM